MRSRTKLLAGPASLLLCLLAPAPARANPHELPFTYPYMTLQSGQFELEQAVDITPVPTLNDQGLFKWSGRTTLTTELEFGITDRLEGSLYLVLGNTDSQPGVYDAYRFAGVKQRLRYRLLDPGVLPVDISFYGEIEEYVNELELEWKVNLEKRLGHFRLLANLWFEHESYWNGRQEWEANPTFGVSYSISPNFSVGVEDWLHTEFGATGAGTSPGDPFFTTPVYNYVGPTAMFQVGPFWISAAFYTRVTEWSTDVQLDDVYGRFWMRSMIGINL
jgi:hypothetical protein